MSNYRKTFSIINKEEILVGQEKGNLDSEDIAIVDASIDKYGCLFYITYSRIYKIGQDARIIIKNKIEVGQGPGEFEHKPHEIVCDPLGNVYIYDGYKIVMFDNDLRYIRNIRINMLPKYPFVVDINGNIYTMYARKKSNTFLLALGIYNPEANIIRDYLSAIKSHQVNRGGIIIHSEHAYCPKVCYCLDIKGELYVAVNNIYQVRKYDSLGNLISIMTMDEKPSKVDPGEKNFIIDKFSKVKINGVPSEDYPPIPANRPFIEALISDDAGVLYIIRKKSVCDEGREETIDIFDSGGAFLYRWNIPFVPKIIYKQYLYYFEYKDDEPFRLKRIQFKNDD